MDTKTVELTKQNALMYGVYNNIFFKLANEINVDVIVTSPPWGSPSCN